MRIYSALQIGDYHTNHCEDYFFIGNIGDDKIICAVMDGCTMATDSYFASTLVGKLLRKVTKEQDYLEIYGLETHHNVYSCLKVVTKKLFNEVNAARNLLMLEQKELLTTLIILLVDTKTKQGIVLVIGDGLVSINGEITDFDQDNKPDYLGFHLNEEFETWYDKQNQKIIFEGARDISIATDGILMFAPVRKTDVDENINPVDFLLFDKAEEENKEMLFLKLKHLEGKFGLKPTDDFAMVRIIL